MKLESYRHIFWKSLNIKCHWNRFSGGGVVLCGQLGGHDKVKSRFFFCNFTNAPSQDLVKVKAFLVRIEQYLSSGDCAVYWPLMLLLPTWWFPFLRAAFITGVAADFCLSLVQRSFLIAALRPGSGPFICVRVVRGWWLLLWQSGLLQAHD